MEQKEIDSYLQQRQIYDLFCRQLVKDFQGAGVSTDGLAGLEEGGSVVRQLLHAAVEAIGKTPDALHRLLYRIDISEAQLRKYGKKFPGLDFTQLVAELIVMRILQKVILKKKFSDG